MRSIRGNCELSLNPLLGFVSISGAFVGVVVSAGGVNSMVLIRNRCRLGSSDVCIRGVAGSICSIFPTNIRGRVDIRHLRSGLVGLAFGVPKERRPKMRC